MSDEPQGYERRLIALTNLVNCSIHKSQDVESLLWTIEMYAALALASPGSNSIIAPQVPPIGLQVAQFATITAVSIPAVGNVGAVKLFISMIIAVATSMLQRGHYLRGAMVVGDLIHTPSAIFGPALVRAHLLEKDVARYPRIILSAEATDYIHAAPMPFPVTRRDRDGLWYLRPMLVTKGNQEQQGIIAEQIARIRDLRKSATANPLEYSNHAWMQSCLEHLLSEAPETPPPVENPFQFKLS